MEDESGVAHHKMEGLCSKTSTFMPKKPETNVRGRKMNVIQLSLQRLAFSLSDSWVSRIAADL